MPATKSPFSQTFSRDAASARADLDRFRRELGTDYLDICLMHCVTEADWTDRYRGVMDVIGKRNEGIIRTTAAPATPLKPYAPPPNHPGWKSISPSSIRSAHSWTPIPQPSSVF